MVLDGSLTLRAHHDEGDLRDGSEHAELVVVAVHLLEADLVLQAKHQDHRVHPAGELREGRGQRSEVRQRNREFCGTLWLSNGVYPEGYFGLVQGVPRIKKKKIVNFKNKNHPDLEFTF